MIEVANGFIPETVAITRVLEIGCGANEHLLAKNAGGELFDDPLVSYIGMDLPQTLQQPTLTNLLAREDIIIGNCVEIPFQDQTFDFVLLRDVFGQFTEGLTKLGIKGVIDLRYGLMEAFRVLKPGGKIVIADECTPYNPHFVEYFLLNAGFRPTDFEYMSEEKWEEVDPEGKWLRLRRKYFNDIPSQRTKWLSDAPPYVLVAEKPVDTEEVTKEYPYDYEAGEVVGYKTFTHGIPLEVEMVTKDEWTASYE